MNEAARRVAAEDVAGALRTLDQSVRAVAALGRHGPPEEPGAAVDGQTMDRLIQVLAEDPSLWADFHACMSLGAIDNRLGRLWRRYQQATLALARVRRAIRGQQALLRGPLASDRRRRTQARLDKLHGQSTRLAAETDAQKIAARLGARLGRADLSPLFAPALCVVFAGERALWQAFRRQVERR